MKYKLNTKHVRFEYVQQSSSILEVCVNEIGNDQRAPLGGIPFHPCHALVVRVPTHYHLLAPSPKTQVRTSSKHVAATLPKLEMKHNIFTWLQRTTVPCRCQEYWKSTLKLHTKQDGKWETFPDICHVQNKSRFTAFSIYTVHNFWMTPFINLMLCIQSLCNLISKYCILSIF